MDPYSNHFLGKQASLTPLSDNSSCLFQMNETLAK